MAKKLIKGLALHAAICSALMMLVGCGNGNAVRISGEEAYSPRHAEGFTIYSTDGKSTVVEVRNPWQGAEGVVTQLFVSRGGENPPEGFDGVTVEAPVGRVVCFSSTHVAFLDAVGASDAVKGVSGGDYISNEKIRAKYASGEVRDVGYDTNVNYELLAGMRPDVVFIYGVGGENTTVTDKFRELRIPYVYVGDYLETTPLGKSEWVVVFGELTDTRKKAEDIFAVTEQRYDSLRTEASLMEDRPKVMLNAPYRDVWFVPGDRSYMAALIKDAGGHYIFEGDDSSVSRPISGESAYLASLKADVWLSPNQATTIAELRTQNPKFTDIRCVEGKRVYNCTRRRTPNGGSDFWESGALYADRVLRDVILCLHPEADDGQGMYYFERLE